MGDKQISAISWKQKLPLRRWKLIGQELEVKCIEKLDIFYSMKIHGTTECCN